MANKTTIKHELLNHIKTALGKTRSMLEYASLKE